MHACSAFIFVFNSFVYFVLRKAIAVRAAFLSRVIIVYHRYHRTCLRDKDITKETRSCPIVLGRQIRIREPFAMSLCSNHITDIYSMIA